MLTFRLESKAAQAALNLLLVQLKEPIKLYKTWGTRVRNKAQANARAKGGRRLWKRIADSVVLAAVSNSGARVMCLSYIGAHKETGGPIAARNRRFLTIPVHPDSKNRTVSEMKLDGVKLFRVGRALGRSDKRGNFVALYALCKRTRAQRADTWWPSESWALMVGQEEALWHLERGH